MTWSYGSPVDAKVGDAALISEEHITALNNMRMQSYIGSIHPSPKRVNEITSYISMLLLCFKDNGGLSCW